MQTNDLAVGELAAVVDERHGALEAADVARALVGLCDLTAIDLDGDGVGA